MARAGIAYVEIRPDLSKFEERLKTALAKIKPKDRQISILPKLDRTFAKTLRDRLNHLNGDFNIALTPELAKGFTRQVKAKLKDAMPDAAVTVNPDAKGLRRKLAEAAKIASAGVKAEIHVDVDKDSPGRVLRALEPISDGVGRLAGSIVTKFTKIFSTLLSVLPGTLEKILASNPIMAVISAAALTAAGIYAAGFIAALLPLGAGVAFTIAGILGLKGDPRVTKAAKSLADKFVKEFKKAASVLREPVIDALNGLKAETGPINKRLEQIFSRLKPAIQPLTKGLVGFIENVLKKFDDATMMKIVELMKIFAGFLPKLGDALGRMLATLANNPNTAVALQVLLDLVVNLTNSLTGFLNFSVTFIANVQRNYQGFMTWWGELWDGWGDIANDTWSGVKRWWSDNVAPFFVKTVPGWLTSLGTSTSNKLAVVKGHFRTAGTFLTVTVPGYFTSMVSGVTGKISDLARKAGEIPGKITSAIGNLGGLLYQAGRNLIQGLINGISDMIDDLERKVGSVASIITDFLKGRSPTRKGPLSGKGWTFYSGQTMARALAQGILSQAGIVADAAERIIPQFTPRLAFAGLGSLPTAKDSQPQVSVLVQVGDEYLTDFVVKVFDDQDQLNARRLMQGRRFP